MKKYFILMLLSFFSLITLTQAKETLNFEWLEYIPNREKIIAYYDLIDIVKTKEGYLAYGTHFAITYDQEGQILKEKYPQEYCDNIKYI